MLWKYSTIYSLNNLTAFHSEVTSLMDEGRTVDVTEL